MKVICLFYFSFFISVYAFSQTSDTLDYPEVGKEMPDFVLRNILFYHKQEMRKNDFKGKWLMLDFWNRSCASCFASFPKSNELQKEFGDRVQVMLVGIQDKEQKIEGIYKKYREHENLILPCAFDSSIAKRFDILLAPHIILLDERGIVRCITTVMSKENMRDFLSGNIPPMPKTYRRMQDEEADSSIPFDFQRPFLIAGNGGKDTAFLFRSVFSKYNENQYPFSIADIGDFAKKGYFQVLGQELTTLYNYAFLGRCCGWDERDTVHYGKYYSNLILMINDSSLFKSIRINDKYINLYNYSLIMPASGCTRQTLQEAMRRDLETYFGYKASLEKRFCPYLALVTKPGASERLKTKGGKSYLKEIPRAGIKAHNQPYSYLKTSLNYLLNEYWEDHTGLEAQLRGNIDFDLDCIPGHIEDVRNALQRNGLDLIVEKKEMLAVVIRDKDKSVSK